MPYIDLKKCGDASSQVKPEWLSGKRKPRPLESFKMVPSALVEKFVVPSVYLSGYTLQSGSVSSMHCFLGNS